MTSYTKELARDVFLARIAHLPPGAGGGNGVAAKEMAIESIEVAKMFEATMLVAEQPPVEAPKVVKK